MLCKSNLDSHFSKSGDCVKKVEDRWFRLYRKFISVSLDQSKTINLQVLRKMLILTHPKVLSMLLLIHQPLLKVALKMKTFSFNAMMHLAQQESLQHLFVYRPLSSFTSLVLFEYSNVAR